MNLSEPLAYLTLWLRRSFWGFLFVGICFSTLPHESWAQQRISILQADQILAKTVKGQKLQKLIGRVIVETDSLKMYCDSAYNYTGRQQIEAFGNIEIQTKQEWIWSDHLFYDLGTDISEFTGRVIVVNDSTTIYGDQLLYNFGSDIARFKEPILMKDKRGRLRANQGIYYQKQDSAQFYGQVQVADSNQYLESDSLYTNRATGKYELFDRVFINDRKNRTRLNGDFMEADSTGRRLIIGHAYIESRSDSTQSDSATVDTTYINAERILVQRMDSVRQIDATTEVRIWSNDFSALGDTARYLSAPEQFWLWSKPIAWHEQIQLTAPTIKAFLTDNQLDRLLSYPNPFAVQKDTALDRLNQIKGDTLTADFAGGQVQTIHTYPTSEMLYFTKKEDGSPDGAINIRAATLTITFEDGAVYDFTARSNPEGKFLPESDQVASKRLDGFAWNPDQRPLKSDFSDFNYRKWDSIPQLPHFAKDWPRRYIDYVEQDSTRHILTSDSL
jgi:lipopolysaccharide export system protein LptA